MGFEVEDPEKVEKWTVCFTGRQVLAIGATYKIVELLECPFNRILETLYKRYEHIRCVSVRLGHYSVQLFTDGE